MNSRSVGRSDPNQYVELSDPDLSRKNPSLGEALSLIRARTPFGADLLEISKAVRVYTGPLAGCMGMATSFWKTELSDQNALSENVVVLLHELKHNDEVRQPDPVIYKHKIKRRKKMDVSSDAEIDCLSFLRRVLYSEAGAETCAIRAAFEMKQNGYGDLFTACAYANDPTHRKAKYAPLYRLFEASYLEACKSEDNSTALLMAGTAAYNNYVGQADLVYAYGLSVLEIYVERLARHVSRSYPVKRFHDEEALGYARVGQEFVAQKATHPATVAGLFKDNPLLGQAFAFVIAKQVLDVRPSHASLANDKFVRQSLYDARRTVEDKGNPFVTADVAFAKIWKIYRDINFKGDVFHAMCEASGVAYPSAGQPVPAEASHIAAPKLRRRTYTMHAL